MASKRKENRPCGAVLPGLYPTPGTSPNLNQGLDRGAGGRSRSRVGATNHARCVAEEAAHAALVHDCRVAIDRVTDRRRTSCLHISEEIAALAVGSGGGI